MTALTCSIPELHNWPLSADPYNIIGCAWPFNCVFVILYLYSCLYVCAFVFLYSDLCVCMCVFGFMCDVFVSFLYLSICFFLYLCIFIFVFVFVYIYLCICVIVFVHFCALFADLYNGRWRLADQLWPFLRQESAAPISDPLAPDRDMWPALTNRLDQDGNDQQKYK